MMNDRDEESASELGGVDHQYRYVTVLLFPGKFDFDLFLVAAKKEEDVSRR